MKPLVGLAAGVLCAGVASAQTATVTVVHDDPDGLVEPGQTVRIDVLVEWEPATAWFAGLQGDLGPTPGVGAASNVASIFPQSALVNWGQVSGGGITGLQFAIVPPFGLWCYPWPPPGGGGTGLIGPLVSYDWTAPTDYLGPVSFDWRSPAGVPNLRVFPSLLSPVFIEASTAYTPATLTVVPGPGGAVVVGVAAALASRRSRRAIPSTCRSPS
ncbi:MAG: hypothetical protein H6809_04410 [Phycisphaeraceae bacterium]|nr:hypothetical protein [Phycisphaeraceae bacterium]